MKISIALLWPAYLFFGIRNIYMASESLTYEEFLDTSVYCKIIELFGLTFLLLQHWHLTSHYMKTSCLLRLAFSHHTASAIRAQNRSSRLRYVDYSYYAFVLVIIVLAIWL